MPRYSSFGIPAESLGDKNRTIRIYTPKSYEKSNKSYPVLYMHDGQNLFDPETSSFGNTWRVSETLDELDIDLIIIGIDHGEGESRLDELSPWVNREVKLHYPELCSRDVGGKGDQYLNFIVNELKPYVDGHYRTLPEAKDTAICGSSMGGLFSLYAGIKRSDVFSRLAALSSSIWFSKAEVLNFLDKADLSGMSKVYMDVGSNEGDEPELFAEQSKEAFGVIKQKMPPENTKFIVIEGAVHSEGAWADRFSDIIRWLFPELIQK